MKTLMYRKKIEHTQVAYNDRDLSEQEIRSYIAYLEKKTDKKVEQLTVEIDGEFANLTYETVRVPFERIRRITGYLVGTMERWNDAKTAEEADRVKHAVEKEELSE